MLKVMLGNNPHIQSPFSFYLLFLSHIPLSPLLHSLPVYDLSSVAYLQPTTSIPCWMDDWMAMFLDVVVWPWSFEYPCYIYLC